jgi:hypothetical protein
MFPVNRSDDAGLVPIAMLSAHGDRHLAQDALQHVSVQKLRGLFQPDRGPLQAWAARVIHNFCVDHNNPARRAAGGGFAGRDRAAPSGLAGLEMRLDLAMPFCDEDRLAVLRIPPRSRFVVLGWTCLWQKLPAEDQQETLAAVPLALPFPVADFAAWSNFDRTTYLAEAAGIARNSIHQILRRELGKIARLRFIHNLLDDWQRG